ncbi:MAG: integrase core domain-containing protein [Eggerthellaceae bacterium]
MRLSCGRTGSCHDNAVTESFFATLKNEMCYRTSFATRADARHVVVEFIESHCNRRRFHSSIGYRIPGRAMDDFFKRTAPGPESLPIAA